MNFLKTVLSYFDLRSGRWDGDSVIGRDTTFFGTLIIAKNTTLTICGRAACDSVFGQTDAFNTTPTLGAPNTTLVVNGIMTGMGSSELKSTIPNTLEVNVHNVTLSGDMACNVLTVEGTLTLKDGSTLHASKIYYRELVIETGAVVHGQLLHLDHVSEGEQT